MSVVLFLALTARAADVTCDGFDDLVVGVVGEDNDAGGVQILHGGTSGITTVDTWRPASHSMVGGAYHLGTAFGSSDVDNDGCPELAVASAGGLFVRNYVPPNPFGGEWWDLYEDELYGVTADTVAISSVIGATMNTNFPTYEDFVVGGRAFDVDGEFSTTVDAGLLYLSDDGAGALATPAGSLTGVHHDHLAVGDFDGNGYDDLAASGWDAVAGGSVEVYFGSSMLLAFPLDTFDQEDIGLETTDSSDYFGTAIASGDFDDDGYDDLAIGADGEDGFSGAVNIIPGGPGGPDLGTARLLRAGVAGVGGTAGAHAFFGDSLVTADFNGDGYDDLAIGAYTSSFYANNAGAVHVLYGSNNGLSTSNDQLWGQNTSGFEGTSGFGDQFGHALGAGDWNNDGYDDLAIGVPGETADCGNVYRAGAVNLLNGSANRLTVTGDKLITQNSTSIDSSCEEYDEFGAVLH